MLKTNKTKRQKSAKREKERHQERTKGAEEGAVGGWGSDFGQAARFVGSVCGSQINDRHGQLYSTVTVTDTVPRCGYRTLYHAQERAPVAIGKLSRKCDYSAKRQEAVLTKLLPSALAVSRA